VPNSWTLELLALTATLLLGAVVWLAGRLAALRRELAVLARARAVESASRQLAAIRAVWLEVALEAGRDGVLIVDGGLLVVHWNRRFADLNGLPPDMPHEGSTLAGLLRLSAEAGEFGLVDVEREVAAQVALIEQGPGAFPRLRHRPDGSIVEFTLEKPPGGGLLLGCADVTARHRPAATAAPPPPATAAPPPAAAPSTATSTGPSAAPTQPPGPRARRCLVLLVEDMKVNQMVTATQLRREGHRVDVAASGAEALHLAATTPYDVVLMDLMMPGMSGYDAARRLRAMPSPTGRTPIFALTANTGEGERARCLAAGMQGMLSKPVPAALLRDALQHGAAATAPAIPPGDMLLDAARLAELRRDLPAAVLATLCRQCLDDMRDRLAALHKALAQQVAEPVEREAHALSGMAGSYGLARIERHARAILAPARAHDLAAARDAANGIIDAFDQSRAALLAWVEHQP